MKCFDSNIEQAQFVYTVLNIACQNMSGADTASSMIYTCLRLYVLTSVHFGRNSRNHSRTVLEHTVYLRYDIKGYFQYQLMVCVRILSSTNKH